MIEIKFKVTETDVSIVEKSEKLTAGNVENIKCIFDLDKAFDDLIVRASYNGICKTLKNGECYAPELAEGKCIIGVYGYSIDDDNHIELRISPEPCVEYIHQGSYNQSDSEANQPLPSELEQIINDAKSATLKAENISKVLAEAKEKGEFNGKDGEKGENYILTESDKLDIAALASSGTLKFYSIGSDEEFESVVEKITGEFCVGYSVLVIFTYTQDDADDGGYAEGEGFICFDSGSGDIDDGYMVPYVSNQEAVNNATKFINSYDHQVMWKQIKPNGLSYTDDISLSNEPAKEFMFKILVNSRSVTDIARLRLTGGTSTSFKLSDSILDKLVGDNITLAVHGSVGDEVFFIEETWQNDDGVLLYSNSYFMSTTASLNKGSNRVVVTITSGNSDDSIVEVYGRG